MLKSRWWVPDAETAAARLDVPLDKVLYAMEKSDTPLKRNEKGEFYVPEIMSLLEMAPKSRAETAKRTVPRTLRDVRNREDAMLLKEMKSVEMIQLRIDERAGKLVLKADVERTLAGLASAVRSVLASAPSRHAALLSAKFSVPTHDMRMALDSIFDEVGDSLKAILMGGR